MNVGETRKKEKKEEKKTHTEHRNPSITRNVPNSAES